MSFVLLGVYFDNEFPYRTNGKQPYIVQKKKLGNLNEK